MIYRDKLIVEISFHARKRAMEKGISFDMILATIKGGKIERFGRNRLRFVSSYKKGNVVCVGDEKFKNFVKIFTIEWRWK